MFLTYGVGAYLLAGLVTGEWIPAGSGSGLWYLSVVGLLTFRLLTSPFFVRPRDSLATAVAGALVLWAIDLSGAVDPRVFVPFKWLSLVALVFVALCASVAIWWGEPDPASRPRAAVAARGCYSISNQLGAGAIVFTPSALIGALGFVPNGSSGSAVLTVAWVVLAVARPLEKLRIVWKHATARRADAESRERVGTVERIDDPGLVRVALEDSKSWRADGVLVALLPDGRPAYVLPLFLQTRDTGPVGTGLLLYDKEAPAPPDAGQVATAAGTPAREQLLEPLTGGEPADLVGFVVENSRVLVIQFEVAGDRGLRQGAVVCCGVRKETVHYQITDARTTEESFDRNPRGTIVVTAAQLGVRAGGAGFRSCSWPPAMNSPVFARATSVKPARPEKGFFVGHVPDTDTWVEASFDTLVELHGAVLGATGMGKTEFVFDVVREGLGRGAKIVCVDFTEEYKARLADHDPAPLGFSSERCKELSDLIDAVETGEYGAANEKKALNEFIAAVRPEVSGQVSAFLEAKGPGLGIFELEDIANTRSTLRATELYVSQIFSWAKKHRRERQILVVLEEAHTVVPEFNLYRHDKSDTDAVVGRISQIALQGRKYGVGLLVVSQRTALVSKTILSQCGTVIAFSMVDKTSLDYLATVFDPSHCAAIPNLGHRHAIVGGPAVASERPLIVEIPYDPAKAMAAEALC